MAKIIEREETIFLLVCLSVEIGIISWESEREWMIIRSSAGGRVNESEWIMRVRPQWVRSKTKRRRRWREGRGGGKGGWTANGTGRTELPSPALFENEQNRGSIGHPRDHIAASEKGWPKTFETGKSGKGPFRCGVFD